MTGPPDPRRRRAIQLWIAMGLWGLTLVVVSLIVARHPGRRTVTATLHQAAADFWAREDLYRGHWGFNYLPQAAILFSPFHAIAELGPQADATGDRTDHLDAAGPQVALAVAEINLRVTSLLLLVAGLVLIARSLSPDNWPAPFMWMTILSMWACLGALRNGQPNAPFAALQVLGVAMILRRRWWSASALLALATAVKPLAIPIMGLAPFVYPAMWVPLIVCNGVMLGVPFLLGPFEYVAGQYASFAHNLTDTATVTEHRFADIAGITRTLGFELPAAVSLAVRAGAGLATLGVWIAVGRRASEPFRGLLLLSLAAAYVALFNPMTEANSYVIVAPAMAAMAVFLSDFDGHRRAGVTIAVLVLSIGLLPEPLRRLLPDFALWWNPTATAIFAGLVIHRAWQR